MTRPTDDDDRAGPAEVLLGNLGTWVVRSILVIGVALLFIAAWQLAVVVTLIGIAGFVWWRSHRLRS